MSIAVILFSFYRFSSADLVTQIVEALLILLAIKFLEDKKFRDYMQIYAIVLFLLAGLALLSLDIVFIVYLLVTIILLTTSIVLLTYYSEDPNLEFTREITVKIVLKSMYIPLIAIPLAAAMFVILPRTQYPILGFLNREDRAKTGFTDNVRLGGVSGIQEDASVILRANMAKIDETELYWRGVVLDYFDGISWRNLNKNLAIPTKGIDVKGVQVRQTIYLEPYNNNFLFAIDKPVHISLRGSRKFNDLTFATYGYIEKRIKYEAISVVSDTMHEPLLNKDIYLQLPRNISSRVKNLVQNITSGKNREDIIRSLYMYLNDGKYGYSLENLPVTKTPLDSFLFEVKYGNCEYFASAYTVMLRIAGIPSRVVGGYKGGFYNEVGQYYLVPQKNAHVWTEAYMPGKGWVRIDPTPASIYNFTSIQRQNIFLRLNLLLDTINYYWYVSVINYNFEKQISIVHNLRHFFKKPKIEFPFSRIDKSLYRYVFFSILLTAVIATSLFLLIRSRQPKEKKILALFLNKMKKYGYTKKQSQGLEEFVSNIKENDIRFSAYLFVQEYEKIFYQDKKITPKDEKKLVSIFK